MRVKIYRMVAVVALAGVAGCVSASQTDPGKLMEQRAQCLLPMLRANAVPTEKVAREIYLAVWRGAAENGYASGEFPLDGPAADSGWIIKVIDSGDTWELYPYNDAVADIAGGGFSMEIEKCSGTILFAGYVR